MDHNEAKQDESPPGSYFRPCCMVALERYKQGLLDLEAKRRAEVRKSEERYFQVWAPLFVSIVLTAGLLFGDRVKLDSGYTTIAIFASACWLINFLNLHKWWKKRRASLARS